MSAFGDAPLAERFKISELTIQRMRKGKGKDRPFDWSEFSALREQVAQEQLRAKPPLWQRAIAAVCDRLIRWLIKFRLAVVKD